MSTSPAANLPDKFPAAVAHRRGEPARLGLLSPADLPEFPVLIRVTHSSLNYKDGLALLGRPGVLRRFPLVPGIDLAGEVVEGSGPGFGPGSRVLVTGWGIGEETSGGYAAYARVQPQWVQPLPAGTDEAWAMAVGTAGFTAMLAVLALERHVLYGGLPRGPVLVTGASGGVGSAAVALLSAAGREVVASTGRLDQAEYLRGLGAAQVIHRAEVSDLTRPLESERWAAVVDTVGGATLAGAVAATARQGAAAVCGLAGGSDLNATVFPLILRGVSLLGIDSVACPQPLRTEAWDRLARDLPPERLQGMAAEYPLEQVLELAERILAGQIRGRTVIRLP